MKILRKIIIIIPLILILLPCSILLASDITNADYRITIQATNNSTLAENVAANFTLSTDDLITLGILNSSATNIVARSDSGTDVVFQPGYDDYPWIIYYSSILATTSKLSYIYTGDVSGGLIRWFPGPTGGTVSSNSSLSIGNSGNYTMSLFFNPLSTGYLVDIPGVITAQGNGSGNVTITPYISTNSCAFRPNGVGVMTQLTPSAGANWECVSDNAVPIKRVSMLNTTYKGDLYTLDDHTTETGTITSVIVSFVINADAGHTCYAKPQWKIGSTSYNGTEQTTSGTTVVTKYQTYTTSPATGLAWTWEELDSAQLGVWLKNDANFTSYCMELFCIVYYNGVSPTTVSAYADAGEHIFQIYINGGILGIKVDSDAAQTVAYADNLTSTSSNLSFVSDDIALFVEYIEVINNGVQTGYYDWQYGEVFLDDSGYGNTMTPSFRATSSDSDVSAALTSFIPLSQAVASPEVISEWPEMIEGAPDMPTTMYTENETPGLFIGPLIEAIWPDDIPISIFWYNFTFTIILLFSIRTFYIFASRGQNALLLKCIVSTAIMIAWSLPGLNVYGMYVPLYHIFWCFGIIVLSRNYGW